MTTQTMSGRDARLVVLVNRYATPFAIFLVLLGIVVSSPLGAVRNLCIGLLAFSVLFNLVSVRLIRRLAETHPGIKKVRMGVNLGVNIALVYLLGPFWPPMWLLLALTPIATAIYEGPAQTLLVSAGTSGIILVIHALRGGSSPHEWGQVLSYAAFIILVSLLINELTQASYPNHPQHR